MNIPLVDLKAQHEQIGGEVEAAIRSVISDTAFIGGKYVSAFEEAFSRFLGIEYVVGVGNGTDALFLALKSLGIGTGDEVIVPAISFVATSEAVSMTGARPVFADVYHEDALIDVERAAEAITDRTRAILPVHLYGQSADLGAIMQLAEEKGLYVIEDCAQSHGSRYHDGMSGTIGNAGCFSFYPGKNLGAYGDAGAVACSSKELAESVRMRANHGRKSKYDHEFEGVNSRLDALQAAVLGVKLQYLPEWTANRQRVAALYTEQLEGIDGITTPVIHEDRSHVFHLYVLRCGERDDLLDFLRSHEIGAGIHYPIPLPLLQAYQSEGYVREAFPVASGIADEVISLPIFPELSEEQVEKVSQTIRRYFDD